MKHKKLIFFVATAIMSFGVLTPLMMRDLGLKEKEPDNAVYDEDPSVVDFNNPEEIVSPAPKRAAEKPAGLTLHYHNDDGKCIPDTSKGYVGREFHVWASGVAGSNRQVQPGGTATDITLSLPFTGDDAAFAKKTSIFFIAKHKGDTNWDGKSDNTEIIYEDYTLNSSGFIEVWVIPGEGSALEVYASQEETQKNRFVSASFKSWKSIDVIATSKPKSYKLYALTGTYMQLNAYMRAQQLPNYLLSEGGAPNCTKVDLDPNPDDDVHTWAWKFTITLNHTIRINAQYYLEGVLNSDDHPEWGDYIKTKYIASHELYSSNYFHQYYEYDGNDLGAKYNGDSTTFKLWAPSAARVRLKLFKTGTSTNHDGEEEGIEGDDSARYYNMAFKKGGVWEITVTGQDLTQSYPYYNYYIYNSLGASTVMDPYAKGCGIDGERAMVVNWAVTNPEGWNTVPTVWNTDQLESSAPVGTQAAYNIKTPNELSIYEVHIRDLTMHSSWKSNHNIEPGTFNAFTESGTTLEGSPEISTGFDHVKDLGVKAIQLVPVFDHDNAEERINRHYNWGYNPLNFNCVEGSYSSNPYDGNVRIKEFKSFIKAFADTNSHTRTIMDVVYNHVNSASDSCFNKIMPRYYFRMTTNGEYYNGSGCGNEVKSEAPMMRKYIVDSLCFWASEYKIKGFRFDLMGLIDVGTIDAARKALYKIDPDIYIYGEGWTGDGSGYSYDGAYAGSAWQVHGNQDMHDGTNNEDGRLITTEEQRKLLGCVRSSVYRYLYPVAKTCYVGMFNDNGRNALKGGNTYMKGENHDEINGEFWGFIAQGSGDVGGKSSDVADMIAGYHTGYGGNPNQCVNYASCHDNYALFDQMVATVGVYQGMERACEATIACEMAILFSNGAAFIRAGEEVFHTKVITPGSEDDQLAIRDKWEMINNKKISHDSYNLSDDVNAFDWTRKKQIVDSLGTVQTLRYYNELKAAIATRNNMKKYTKEQLDAMNPYSSGDHFNIWGKGDGSTTVAVFNKSYTNANYFFFINGVKAGDGFSFSPYFNDNVTNIIFDSGRNNGNKGFTPDAGTQSLKFANGSAVCLH